MFEKEEKLDFHDLRIKPAVLSSIASRSEIDPFYEYSNGEKHLPIFTAPMDTVISLKNIDCFHRNKIRGVLPRGENEYFCGKEPLFNAMGLDEFINFYVIISDKALKIQSSKVNYILIDIANGHMEKLLNAVKIAKSKFKSQLILMVGNVANPETFVNLAKAGADYIRIGVGNGNACVLEGSKVITKEEYKNIEDVRIGDCVLTHKGRFQEVVSTTAFPTKEPLIQINDIICTLDHKFYVLHKKYQEMVNDENIHEHSEWIMAKDLTDEYFLLEMANNV